MDLKCYHVSEPKKINPASHEKEARIHEHERAPGTTKYLGIALAITAIFFIVELIGGVLTRSLALQSDAWHMLRDMAALAFAFMVARLALKPPSVRKTYGYHRAEILSSFLNGMFLIAVMVFIILQAISRLRNPVEIETEGMLLIAVAGLVANVLAALALTKSEESLNVRAAMLHCLSDATASVGVIVGGVIIHFTGLHHIDAVISIIIAVVVVYFSLRIIFQSMNILLEGAPPGVDPKAVERRIRRFKGVKDIHDLHIWCMTPTRVCAMSCHVVIEDGVNRKNLITSMMFALKEEFGIDHTTIQLEEKGYPKSAEEHH